MLLVMVNDRSAPLAVSHSSSRAPAVPLVGTASVVELVKDAACQDEAL
jgi:hypothetical protein